MVVCNDDRNDEWIKLLSRNVSDLYMIKASQFRYFTLDNPRGRSLPRRKLPEFVDAILVHYSDMKILGNIPIESKHIFEFNTPGTPQEHPEVIPIYRQTFPYFAIAPSDIDELIAFIAGERPELPSMCRPAHTPDLLPALLLLCQQYLESSREDGQSSIVNQPKWWLDSLGLLEQDDLNQGAYQTALKCLQEEWQRSKQPELSRASVDRLLAQLVRQQPTGFAITPSDVTYQIVADAHRTLRQLISPATEETSLRQLDTANERPDAILTIEGSFLTAASAAILFLRLKARQPQIQRHVLKQDTLDTLPTPLRHSPLLLTKQQIAHLPALRQHGFAGAVLVLSQDTFAVLKQNHRVLRFGQGSHNALPLPFTPTTLVNTVINLVPMEPENLHFFQREMDAIRQIYARRIVPCLQKLEQPDQDPAALQPEIASLIAELRSQTPVACHTLVTIDNQSLQIQQHFRRALANLEAQQDPQSAVAYLKAAFAQWYQLVK